MKGPRPTLAKHLEGRRVGVVLSAGFFGFFGHAGFVAALEEAGITPACWAGTSAGALVGAMAASGMPARQLIDRLSVVKRADFWDPDPIGAVAAGLRGHAATGLLRGGRLRRLLERELPPRFEDLKAPCVVVAANLSRSEPQAFASGELAPRVHASCAYPGLFRAAQVDGELYWDGGLVDKAPALALWKANRPQVLLVHYLPSRAGGAPAGWGAYPKAMAGAMAALRKDHFRLQVEVLRAVGVEIIVLTTELPALGPLRLEKGPLVAEEARRKTAETLDCFFTAPAGDG
ncbi:MAG: patatin-like phospholipase family protein [Deltaproteobacteria bacterium]|nr:patatin-like phospholipase family protein [Deltaproteobacteria bacterium]